MTTHRPHHVHLESSGFYNGHLTIDGEDFPFPIRSVNYNLQAGVGPYPTITVEFEVDHLTIEQKMPQHEFNREWDDRVNEAFMAAETGVPMQYTGEHADAEIRIQVIPKVTA